MFGAPFDSTTSFRPGARFGSSAIRHESFGLETYSPYQDKDLTDIKVFDCGDLELCFGSAEAALKDIEEKAGEILFDGKPINEIDKAVFRGSLAVVDQDITLFEDTIANNIKMWDNSIEDFEMILAARDGKTIFD